MRKWHKSLTVILTTAAFLVVNLIVIAQDNVAISPQTLNLDQFAGVEITVHAEQIPYDADADVALVSENGRTIFAVETFDDSRGDLVAKFDVEEVEGLVEEEEVTLTLCLYVDDVYWGSDTIRVISGGKKEGE